MLLSRACFWGGCFRITIEPILTPTPIATPTQSPTPYHKPTPTPHSKPTLYDAYEDMQQNILDQLKAPSTATFCDYADCEFVVYDDGSIVVKGWVDAQNSYGAMLRTHFRSTVTYDAQGNADIYSMLFPVD